MNDTSKKCSSSPRVLFLRSHGNVIAPSVVAHGLRACQSIEFSQYPAWPDEFRTVLHKLGRSEETWNALHTNIIATSRELFTRLARREFDLILLADYNEILFQYIQGDSQQKFRIMINGLRKRTIKKWSTIIQLIQYYRYVCSMPFSLKKLSQFAPIVAIEMADLSYLTLENLEILRESCFYFKREIPYNRFALFTVRHFTSKGREFINQEITNDSNQKSILGSWKEKQGLLHHLIEKVHSIPLGIENSKYAALKQQRAATQDIDVLFLGEITNTLRKTGMEQLQEFASRSCWNIVIKQGVPFNEYCCMIARSKITISIAGGGWDCFRHYEAVALGSVPLINKPTIDAVWWHSMPEEVFFENTFSNFTARIEQLLNDEQLRKTCLATLEQQVEQHMLHSKIVEYIVSTSLEKLSRRTPEE